MGIVSQMASGHSFFNSLAVALLAGVYGVSFGFTLLFGELVKPLSIALSEPETTFIDLGSSQLAISVGVGLFATLVSLTLKWAKISEKTRLVVNLALVTLGAILFTGGCLVIGWEPPSLTIYTRLLMTMVAPGVGLITWGSSLVVLDQVDVLTWRNKALVALYLCSTPLFILLFFPSLQLTSSNDYFLPYRTVGTLMSPITLLLVVLVFNLVTLPNEADERPSVKRPSPSAVLWWSSFICFAAARSLFFAVFTTSFSFFPNYVVHIAGNETGFDSIEAGLEDRVIRDCMLWMAAGTILSRAIYVFVAGDLTRVFFHASAMAVLGGWYVRIQSTDFVGVTGIELCAVAFFIGFTVGQIFTDYLHVTAYKYDHAKVPFELRMIIVGVGMLVVGSCMRISVGFFGGSGTSIDWTFMSVLNLSLMGGVVGLELAGMALYPKNMGDNKVASE